VLIAVLAIVAVFGIKLYHKSSDAHEIESGMHEWIEQSPGYSADPPYYDRLFESAHPAAFEHHYRMEGRRRSASFDDEAYMRELCQAMIGRAREDGRPEVVENLTLVQNAYLAAPDN